MSAVLLLCGAACSDDPIASRPPFLAASTNVIDFGDVPVGDAEDRTLFIINKGDIPMRLEEPSGVLQGVFSATLGNTQVPPQDDVIVHISFSPQDAVQYETEYVFPNDSQNESEFKVTLRGKGIVADPCRDVTCNTPPGRTCVGTTTSRQYNPFGTCVEGKCHYEAIDQSCGNFGCNLETGACASDPCAGVVCQTPPNGCFLTNGMCQNGACLYTVNNGGDCNDGDLCTLNDACSEGQCRGTRRTCELPPGQYCMDGQTLRKYDPQGACNQQGICVYTPQDVRCRFGCETDRCKDDPCAGGCDDGNPCTRDSCLEQVGCKHEPNDNASCVADSGECPTGVCAGGRCISKPDVTCVAEYDVDLCMEAEVAGVCSASGRCVVTSPPPEYQCPNCNGICLKCYFINLCIPF